MVSSIPPLLDGLAQGLKIGNRGKRRKTHNTQRKDNFVNVGTLDELPNRVKMQWVGQTRLN